jgi:hypothetical protein
LTKKKAARERSTIWYKTFGKLPEVKAKRKQTLLSWRADKPSNYLCQLARQRSKELNITFDLCPEDILIPAKCPALDVPFEYGTPYAMSIDRINPKLGYVKGNVQVISRKANLMKQDASSEELRTFAKWANKSQN